MLFLLNKRTKGRERKLQDNRYKNFNKKLEN